MRIRWRHATRHSYPAGQGLKMCYVIKQCSLNRQQYIGSIDRRCLSFDHVTTSTPCRNKIQILIQKSQMTMRS
jgi:hypothetical protein